MKIHTAGLPAITCILLATAASNLPGQTITTDPTFSPAPTTLQAAMTDIATSGSGGKIILSSGTFNLSTTAAIPAGGNDIHIVGAGRGATIITYGGSSDAIKIGANTGFTTGVSLANLTVDVTAAVSTCTTSSTVGIHAINTEYLTIDNVEVITIRGCANPTGQIGVVLDGEGTFNGGNSDFFTAYTTLLSPRIVGDFTTGIQMTGAVGPRGGQVANATTLVGGAIVNTSASKTGTTGILISHGDTNKADSTGVEGWNIGVDVFANGNGPLALRFESDNTAWQVEGPPNIGFAVNGTSFLGSNFGNFVDLGTNTTYLSNTNGANNSFKLSGCTFSTGSGAPSISGSKCDIYLNTAGGTSTTLYVNETEAAAAGSQNSQPDLASDLRFKPAKRRSSPQIRGRVPFLIQEHSHPRNI